MGVIIQTERLKFERIQCVDIDDILIITSDIQTMQYFPCVLNYQETCDIVKEIINHYSNYGFCFWKIMLKESDEFIGIAGLLHQNVYGVYETEVAYRIRREYWGNGYATESAKACIEYAKSSLGKKRLISIINTENLMSKRVADKLGAKIECTMKFNGVNHDVYVYQA